MVSAGQVVTPLEWGVVAPPLIPEGTAVLPFDVGASGGYGEQPYLEEYDVPQETDQGAAASPAGADWDGGSLSSDIAPHEGRDRCLP